MDDLPNIKTAIDLLYEAEFQIRDKIESDPFRIFNVFDVLSVQYKEVIMCRMLKELLDPKGKHGKGNKFLKLFFQVIKESKCEIVPDEDLDKSSNVQVSNEYVIDGNRRIDILVKVGTRYIPIEVKIEACDQQNQVRDYLNYCQTKLEQSGNKGKTVLLYLTLDGHEPSEKSTGSDDSIERSESCSDSCGQNSIQTSPTIDSNLLSDLDNSTELKDPVHSKDLDKDIIPISFKEEICKFLELCLKEADNESLYSNIKQYLYAVESISGNVQTPIIDALVEKLDSKAAFKAVEVLDKALVARKTKFLNSLFEQLEDSLKDFIAEHKQMKCIEIDLDATDGLSSTKKCEDSYITEANILYPYKKKSLMEHKTLVSDYYSCSVKVFPSIILLIGKVKFEQKTYDLALAFEIEDRPYVGLMLIFKNNEGKYYRCNVSNDYHELGEKLKERLEKIADIKSFNQENWMLDWKYVSAYGENLTEIINEIPIFSNCNDAYFEILKSEDRRKSFIYKGATSTLILYLDVVLENV